MNCYLDSIRPKTVFDRKDIVGWTIQSLSLLSRISMKITPLSPSLRSHDLLVDFLGFLPLTFLTDLREMVLIEKS